MKTCLLIVALFTVSFLPSISRAQLPYYGALLYSTQRDTVEPPFYSGQPPAVIAAYFAAELAMRRFTQSQIDSIISIFPWNDTAKAIASMYYQMKHDNPLAFSLWEEGVSRKPDPHIGRPGHTEAKFLDFSNSDIGDTGRTHYLLSADIIAHVYVTDTQCFIDPSSRRAPDAVLVNSTIIDTIKGRRVPSCSFEGIRTKAGQKTHPQSIGTIPIPTTSVLAVPGSCIKFEYSPEWNRITSSDEGLVKLKDSTGWWVKPGHEYIVFLYLRGIADDSLTYYFTLWPGGGNSGGIYRIGSFVEDPFDDFGFGSTSLPPVAWKTHLRSRINSIVNP